MCFQIPGITKIYSALSSHEGSGQNVRTYNKITHISYHRTFHVDVSLLCKVLVELSSAKNIQLLLLSANK